MTTENFVNLVKTSEMPVIKDEFLARRISTQNKTFDNFGRKMKKISI